METNPVFSNNITNNITCVMEIEADLGQILVAVLSCNLVSHSDFTFVKCLFLDLIYE